MSTNSVALEPVLGQRESDRLLFLFMTALFLATAVAGFAPRSAAILTGATQVPPLVIHLHAAVMVSWILLLVVQASLVSTGRVRLHRTLGTISFVLAPVLFAVLTTVAIVRYGDLTRAGLGPFVSNILLVQIRAIVLFPLFYLWAISARVRDPAAHKRMMLLATLVLLDAAIARMTWLPGTNSATTYDGVHAYLLLLVAPALLYDWLNLGRVHRAYVLGLAILAPWIIATHFLWNSPWWHTTAARLMGMG
jgi:hypothetical protein